MDRIHEVQVNQVLFPKDSLAQVIEQNKRLEKTKKSNKATEQQRKATNDNMGLRAQFSDSWPSFTKRIEQEFSVVRSVANLNYMDVSVGKGSQSKQQEYVEIVLKNLYSHFTAKIEDYMIRFDTDDSNQSNLSKNKDANTTE